MSRLFTLAAGLVTGLLTTLSAHAFTIAKGLNSSDRREVTRTLGLNSANKSVTSPYPLGGFAGWEVGYAVEVIDVRGLREVGDTDVTAESSWRYSRLTIGKGLYNNIDLFFSFVPPTGAVTMSDFGGMLRWSVFQATFLPINVSLVAHANQTNVANRFSNRNVGADATVGVTFDAFAAYVGLGVLQASGKFLGPDVNGNCNDDCTVNDLTAINTLTRAVGQDLSATRTVLGVSYRFAHLFAAAEVTRVDSAVYSVKLGVRY